MFIFHRISVTSEVSELSDWIWDVCWLEDESPAELAVVLAHNSVMRWDWRRRLVLQHVHCEENCILYPSFVFYLFGSFLVIHAL